MNNYYTGSLNVLVLDKDNKFSTLYVLIFRVFLVFFSQNKLNLF